MFGVSEWILGLFGGAGLLGFLAMWWGKRQRKLGKYEGAEEGVRAARAARAHVAEATEQVQRVIDITTERRKAQMVNEAALRLGRYPSEAEVAEMLGEANK